MFNFTKNNKILLILASLIVLLLYLPTLSYFPEGDDLLFLWHIRVPVNYFVLPFYGWEEPVAGRFGYGQAWYGAAVYKIFGFQPVIFNLFGILFKILALVTIFVFAKRMTNNKIIPIVSIFTFAILSTGLNGEVNLYLHFSLVFMALFLYSSALFIEGLENKSYRKIIFGSILLVLGNYLYTIRAIGIVFLPFLVLLRNIPIQLSKNFIYQISLSVFIVFLSVVLVVKLIPGANNYASQTLIESTTSIISTVNSGNYEYLRSILVSTGLLSLNREFYSLVNQLFGAGHNIMAYLLFWSLLIWTILFLLFALPLYLLKEVSKRQLIIGSSIGIGWSLLIGFLYYQKITLFIGGEVSVVTTGIQIILLGLIIGIYYLKINPKIGSTLIASIIAAILFYVPNWLHDPVIVSSTESRYFTVSSGFVSVYLSILFYILFSQANALRIKHKPKLASYTLVFSILIVLIIYLTHLSLLNRVIYENRVVRDGNIISNHWNFVRSRVDFSRRPLIVVVWSDVSIDHARREFFRHQSLGLIGDLPWDYQLTDQVRLYYSMEESIQVICGWKKRGIVFESSQFYDFKITADRQIIDMSQDGREKLSTWVDYCTNQQNKGLEVND